MNNIDTLLLDIAKYVYVIGERTIPNSYLWMVMDPQMSDLGRHTKLVDAIVKVGFAELKHDCLSLTERGKELAKSLDQHIEQNEKDKKESEDIQPTVKHPKMESDLKQAVGFDRRASIICKRCVPAPVGCGGEADVFRDELSRKEYAISGLCQACQDKVFPPNAK